MTELRKEFKIFFHFREPDKEEAQTGEVTADASFGDMIENVGKEVVEQRGKQDLARTWPCAHPTTRTPVPGGAATQRGQHDLKHTQPRAHPTRAHLTRAHPTLRTPVPDGAATHQGQQDLAHTQPRAHPTLAEPRQLDQRAKAQSALPEDSPGEETSLEGPHWKRTSSTGNTTQSDWHWGI